MSAARPSKSERPSHFSSGAPPRELAESELRNAPDPPLPDRARVLGGPVDGPLRLQVDGVPVLLEDGVPPHVRRLVALDALRAKSPPACGNVQDPGLLTALGRGLLGRAALVDGPEILRSHPDDADLLHGRERGGSAHGRDGPIEDDFGGRVQRRGEGRCGRADAQDGGKNESPEAVTRVHGPLLSTIDKRYGLRGGGFQLQLPKTFARANSASSSRRDSRETRSFIRTGESPNEDSPRQ